MAKESKKEKKAKKQSKIKKVGAKKIRHSQMEMDPDKGPEKRK